MTLNTSTPATPATRILAGLLEARTGQQLSPARNWRIDSVLKPIIRDLGLPGIEALVGRIVKGHDQVLATRVVEALLNNESSFFRDLAIFDLLNRDALAALAESRRSSRRLKIWSAGCSTGQEAYSLSIMFRDAGMRWAGWTIDMVATDVSAHAIARARTGKYTQFEIQRGLPARAMLRWFVQDDEDWIVDNDLRRSIRFATHNLFDPPPGRFDLILCRNVMMYFAPDARTKAFDRLASALDPGGILMLGAGETVIGQTDRFVSHPDHRGLYMAAPPKSLAQRGRRTG